MARLDLQKLISVLVLNDVDKILRVVDILIKRQQPESSAFTVEEGCWETC